MSAQREWTSVACERSELVSTRAYQLRKSISTIYFHAYHAETGHLANRLSHFLPIAVTDIACANLKDTGSVQRIGSMFHRYVARGGTKIEQI